MLVAAMIFAGLGCYWTYKSYQLEKEDKQFSLWAYQQSFENASEITELYKHLN